MPPLPYPTNHALEAPDDCQQRLACLKARAIWCLLNGRRQVAFSIVTLPCTEYIVTALILNPPVWEPYDRQHSLQTSLRLPRLRTLFARLP